MFAPGSNYAIEILKLDVDNSALVPLDFGPLACVVPLEPQILASIWQPVRIRSAAASAGPPRERRRAPEVFS